MFCTSCGKELDDNDRFCTQCGAPVGGLTGEAGAESAPSTAEQATIPLEQEVAGQATTPLPEAAPAAQHTTEDSENLTDEASAATDTSGQKKPKKRAAIIAAIIAGVVLVAGVAGAAYYNLAYLPSQQTETAAEEQPTEETQTEESANTQTETTEEAEPLTYGTETVSVTVSIPGDPYYGSGERTEATWTYDQITCSQQSDAVDAINSTVAQAFEASVSETNQTDYSDGSDPTGACTTARDIEITYLSDTVACFRDTRSATAWGAHGWTVTLGVAYSLETGEQINFASIFDMSSSELADATTSAVSTWLASNPSDIMTTSEVLEYTADRAVEPIGYGYTGTLEGCSAYYMDNAGLIYHTEEYELGSFAFGTRSIYVASLGSSSIVGTALED